MTKNEMKLISKLKLMKFNSIGFVKLVSRESIKIELNVMLGIGNKINFKLDAIQNNIHPIIFYGSMRLYYVLSIY